MGKYAKNNIFEYLLITYITSNIHSDIYILQKNR